MLTRLQFNQLTLVTMAMIGQQSLATEIKFLPGDAFFHSRLTGNTVGNNGDDTFVTLYYGTPTWCVPDFGGYAGFGRLRVNDPSSAIKASLGRLYDYFKSHVGIPVERAMVIGSRRSPALSMITGYHVFVYNNDYSIDKFGIGLKYNEDWRNLPESAFSAKGPGIFRPSISGAYRPFLRSYDLAVLDWKYAADVPPLSVKIPPDVGWGLAQAPIEEPLVLDAKDVMLIVIPVEELDNYMNRWTVPWPFYKVTTTGIKNLRWEKGRLYESDWDPD